MGGKKIPLYQRLYRDMRRRIETGAWPAGMRILSVREQAATLGVSKFTIERVYGQLAAEGYIRAHNRARYEVRESVALPEDAVTERIEERKKPAYRYDFISPAMDRDGFRFTEWRRCFYRTLRREDHLLGYGDERGEYELRAVLAQYGADARDTDARAEDIVIGASTQQLLRITAGLLRDRYNEIAFAQEAFSLGADTFADEGYHVDILRGEGEGVPWEQHPARLLYVVPSHTYRTAGVMPARVRADLLACSEEKDGLIIEDDFDSELNYYGRPLPSLQGMGGRSRVVYIGSLSKVLPPSFRIAYMILPPELSEQYEQRRRLYLQTASVAEQLTLAEYIRRGELAKQIRRLRKLYGKKSRALKDALEDAFGDAIRVDPPQAGIYCRVHIRTDVAREVFIKNAAAAGVGLRPEQVTERQRPGEISFLLAFGRMPQEDFPAAASQLYKVYARTAKEA